MEIHVLPGGLFVVETGILKDDAEALAGQLLLHRRIKSVELDTAAGGAQQRGQHLDGGGFAGAVGSEKSEDLTLRDIETDVIDGGEIAEDLDQIGDGNHPRRYLPCDRPDDFYTKPFSYECPVSSLRCDREDQRAFSSGMKWSSTAFFIKPGGSSPWARMKSWKRWALNFAPRASRFPCGVRAVAYSRRNSWSPVLESGRCTVDLLVGEWDGEDDVLGENPHGVGGLQLTGLEFGSMKARAARSRRNCSEMSCPSFGI